MAIGQALLTKPSNTKAPEQQQWQEQELPQIKKTTVFQEQPLKFEQSLQLVQTLLGASIGCLSFLRGLLPEECFVEKRYGGKSSAAVNYRSFTSDIDDESFKKTTTSSGTRVKRLRRGYSGEADQLLDWLEIGIFDALQKGYLKAVQLAIYVDKEHPEIIVESYTFSFSYREKEDGTSTIGLRVTDITGRGVTVEDANKNLQLMMRRLIVITQNLPPLPDQRWLTIRLHYLDHTPSNYDPPSFIRVSSNSSTLKFHESEAREVERLEVGGLDAGFHAVSLKISSMNDTESQERPRRRRGSRFIHADIDIDVPRFIIDSSQKTLKDHNNSINKTLQGLAIDKHDKLRDLSTDKDQKFSNHITIEGSHAQNTNTSGRVGRNTQEKTFLRGMLRQAARESDVIETQPLTDFQANNSGPPIILPESLISNTSQNPVINSTSPTSLPPGPIHVPAYLIQQAPLGAVPATYTPQRQSHQGMNHDIQGAIENSLFKTEKAIELVDKTMSKLKLSKAKTTELKRKGKNIKNTRSPQKSKIIGNLGENKEHEDRINCECGDERKSEEDIICCDNCDEWQHTNCYGFASAKDTRIPDYHVCYSCLLGANEGKLLEEMRNMALFRKALRTIWKQDNFPSLNKTFANKLGCDLPTALQITKRLENEGFITNDVVKARIRRKKVYEVVKTDEIKSHMDTEYFDPLKRISHHFENPTPPNIIYEPILEESLLRNPPQETPITSLMDIPKDSQEIVNTTEEAIILFDQKNNPQISDGDVESTADEEENIPPQETAYNNTSLHRNTMNQLKISNRLNTPGSNPKTTKKSSFEIAESPEPMEIDVTEEPLMPIGLNTAAQIVTTSHSRSPLINIGGVLHDIFVGEELGHRNL